MPTTVNFKNRLLETLTFAPTANQMTLIEMLEDFIFNSGNEELFLIKGYAGTGKTSMVAALTKILPGFKIKTVLLAPTGRAAKVLSLYAGKKSFTIHRKIYQKIIHPDGGVQFGLSENKNKNTLFIVDEASMIGEDRSGNEFSGSNLLGDLLEYVYSGDNCRIIFIGDVAQLPPVGTTLSPALLPEYLHRNFSFTIRWCELKEVVRQASESGILFNATSLRIQLLQQPNVFPELSTFKDVQKISGEELEDAINGAYAKFGEENVLVITRSNKRANLFNQQIRVRIKFREESLSAGDLMMVVKNNYSILEEKSSIGFIANGDAIEILRVIKTIEMYGMLFADVVLRLVDYPDEPEISTLLNLSVVNSEQPNMTFEDQKKLARMILEDLGPEAVKWEQAAYLRKNPFYNALQVKFCYAITCHKSQGGQWPCVFIDKGFITDEMINEEYYRWLYTAITRATEKVYLVNF
jgi:exodeoxyribonuclease V